MSSADEIFGLATAEPGRQNLSVEGVRPALHEMTQHFILREGASAAHRSLRDLRLREQTGASLIAIYRQGALASNPPPDALLLPNDILVLLGNGEECRRASKLLG